MLGMVQSSTSARERILDAYIELLITEGERAATLDAVARAAEVSKGGLLYHFKNKDALVESLIERLDEEIEADVVRLETSPEDAITYFLRTSVNMGTPYDRAILATLRIAQENEQGRDALRRMHERWRVALGPIITDPAVVDVILFISDGIYSRSALDGEVAHSLQDTIDVVLRLLAPAATH
jgi:AcrR family transcriptional regulator